MALNCNFAVIINTFFWSTITAVTTLNLLVNSSNFGARSSESYRGCRHLRQHKRTSPICETYRHAKLCQSLNLPLPKKHTNGTLYLEASTARQAWNVLKEHLESGDNLFPQAFNFSCRDIIQHTLIRFPAVFTVLLMHDCNAPTFFMYWVH